MRDALHRQQLRQQHLNEPHQNQCFAESGATLFPNSRDHQHEAQSEKDADGKDQLRLAMQVVTPTAISVEVEHSGLRSNVLKNTRTGCGSAKIETCDARPMKSPRWIRK